MTHVWHTHSKGVDDATLGKDGSGVPNDGVLVGLPLVPGRVHAGQGVGWGDKRSVFPNHGFFEPGELVVEALDLEVATDQRGTSEVPEELESV